MRLYEAVLVETIAETARKGLPHAHEYVRNIDGALVENNGRILCTGRIWPRPHHGPKFRTDAPFIHAEQECVCSGGAPGPTIHVTMRLGFRG